MIIINKNVVAHAAVLFFGIIAYTSGIFCMESGDDQERAKKLVRGVKIYQQRGSRIATQYSYIINHESSESSKKQLVCEARQRFNALRTSLGNSLGIDLSRFDICDGDPDYFVQTLLWVEAENKIKDIEPIVNFLQNDKDIPDSFLDNGAH